MPQEWKALIKRQDGDPHPYPLLRDRLEVKQPQGLTEEWIQWHQRLRTIAREVMEESKRLDIKSSNLPNSLSPRGAKEEHEVNQSMVFLAQKQADKILEDPNKPSLEQIISIAELTKRFQAGNCMEKAFVGLHMFSKRFAEEGLLTHEHTVPMSVYYYDPSAGRKTTDGHFFLIVGDYNSQSSDPSFHPASLVVDLWAQTTFPAQYLRSNPSLKETAESLDRQHQYEVYHGHLHHFFGITRDWSCFKGRTVDQESFAYTEQFFQQLQQHTPASAESAESGAQSVAAVADQIPDFRKGSAEKRPAPFSIPEVGSAAMAGIKRARREYGGDERKTVYEDHRSRVKALDEALSAAR